MEAIEAICKAEPYHCNWGGFLRKALNVEKIPPITGCIFLGAPYVTIGSADYLQDLYINKCQYVTKHDSCRNGLGPLVGKSVFFIGTDAPGLVERRKALSGAFFKSRLIAMT